MAFNTISEIVLEEIREDILSGSLKPGTKIDQNQLKERFGISAIPIREAFQRLQSEGYVDIVPHRGVHVKPLSRQEIEDLYLVRAEVEALAGRLALPNLTEDDIRELRELFEQMSQLTESGAYVELLKVNRRFHFTIYRACRRTHLLQILDDLWMRSSRYRSLVTVKPSLAKRAIAEHRAILDACSARDSEALVRAIRQNIEETRKVIGMAPDTIDFPMSAQPEKREKLKEIREA
jgi:DNA-binding GntR family transcriptional regulator